MNRTIMIIGGGLLQLPVIQTAKNMGLNVVVTDYNPDAVGMKFADIPLIMSTRDIEGSVRVAKKQNALTPISGVLTVGTDASMTVAAVANALNLPGIKFEDAEAATNKIKMRTRFKEHRVPSPDFSAVWSLHEAKDACNKLGLPVVIKPSDNMGARGVMLIENKNMISDAFHAAKEASPSGELIIEQYMKGPELSIDAIIYNGKVHFTGIADRIIEDLPYFIEKGHTMPSSLSNEIIENAKDVTIQGIKALGITHGFAKGDIKITPEGAKIGELAARLSGGFMSAYTYPLSCGVDLMKAAIEISLGQEPGNLEPIFNKVSIERAIITEPGIVTSIKGLDDAKSVTGINEIFLNVKPGDKVIKPRSNVDKAGHIIATGNTLSEAESAIEECKNILQIEVDKESTITMSLIKAAARVKFSKTCYVCKVCDGENCASSVPGMGASGSGDSFRNNIKSLNKYKINTHIIHDTKVPSTEHSIFSHNISMPVLPAPITGTVTNMGGAVTEDEYAHSVVHGSKLSGTIAFVGDGATPYKYRIGLDAIKANQGLGIPIFKPRVSIDDIIERIKAAEESGAIAVGMDIDAISFKTMKMKNQSVGPKSLNELKDIISATRLPFILKGIMSVKDAELAIQSGAKGIIISNHGGRVLDQMPGCLDVLPQISKAVNKQVLIIADGGFRSGVDVLKGLALGADLVTIGRPVCIAAIGMKEHGVEFYLNTIQNELKKAMLLTGCASISDINSEVVMKL